MNTKRSLPYWPLIMLSVFAFAACEFDDGSNDPALSNLYLTWKTPDTSTRITVNYHTQEEFESAQIFYDTESRDGDPTSYAMTAIGYTTDINRIKRKFHHVSLENLIPGQTYYFVVGDETTGYSGERKFKTIPQDGSPIRFLTGGDMGTGSKTRTLTEVGAANDPQVALIGGDVAYANADITNYEKWREWFKIMDESLMTPDGHMIPMSLAVGNHEINYLEFNKRRRAPFYFEMFDQTGTDETFFLRRFGPDIAVLHLDTGHVNSYSGRQKDWIKETLQAIEGVKQKFAIYHVPLYPAHRTPHGLENVAGRKHWAPLFDQFGLDIAFENHDHTVKKTFRIKDGEVSFNDEGVIYIGDGCWGKGPRKAHPERWYLKAAHSKAHVWYGEAHSESVDLRALGTEGQVIEEHVEN